MDNRTLTQADAMLLYNKYSSILNKLAELAHKGEDTYGNHVGFSLKWSMQITPGIITALSAIANKTALQPIKIYNNTLANPNKAHYAHQCLYELIVNLHGDEFLHIINKYAGNNEDFKKSLLNFRKSIMARLPPKNALSTYGVILIQAPPASTVKTTVPKTSNANAHKNDVSLYFQIPYHSRNEAEQIVRKMKQQGMPIEMDAGVITIGPSKGMGTCGAYKTITELGYNSPIVQYGIEFKDETERKAFADLVGITTPTSGSSYKLYISNPLLTKPAIAIHKTYITMPQQPIINTDLIINWINNYRHLQPGQWNKLMENSLWEVGRSNYNGNLALASSHLQIECANNQLTVLNKPDYNPASNGVRYYALYSASLLLNLVQPLEKKPQDLINTITAQIEKYYLLISKNPKSQEDIHVWLDKIGILGEAISALHGNRIDLDQTANRYPLCRKGDGLVMTSETTKLLNEVKSVINETSQHYQPNGMRP